MEGRMNKKLNLLVLGVGSFAESILSIFKERGANVYCYLTRDYSHYGPLQVCDCYDHKEFPNPCPLIKNLNIDLVIPQSINWAMQPWSREFEQLNVPILSPQ